jgi:hypothetical protein
LTQAPLQVHATIDLTGHFVIGKQTASLRI